MEDFLLTVPVIPVMALLQVVKALGIAHPFIWFTPRVSVYPLNTLFRIPLQRETRLTIGQFMKVKKSPPVIEQKQ